MYIAYQGGDLATSSTRALAAAGADELVDLLAQDGEAKGDPDQHPEDRDKQNDDPDHIKASERACPGAR